MNEKYLKELLLLAEGLMKRGIQFEFCPIFTGGRIIIYEKTKLPYDMVDRSVMKWDAVCHSGSYGHEEGLLEILGVLVDTNKHDDLLEGWLTAEEILKRVDKEAKV